MRLAEQETAAAQATAAEARDETRRVRDDAGKTIAGLRAEAAGELAAVRADLRARAERAETQADTYRADLDQLRARADLSDGTAASETTLRRASRATQP